MRPDQARDPHERFQDMLDKSGECWLWLGQKTTNGYGVFCLGSRADNSVHAIMAHRWAYEETYGLIPEGYTVDHTCHVRGKCTLGNACPHRACTNPAHLEAVPLRENLRRGNTNMAKTHCKRGHPFNEENTYHIPSGGRSCRPCQLEAVKAYQARR